MIKKYHNHKPQTNTWYIYKIWLENVKTKVDVSIGTNCASLVADLFLLCYERNFMLSLSDNNQADVVDISI